MRALVAQPGILATLIAQTKGLGLGQVPHHLAEAAQRRMYGHGRVLPSQSPSSQRVPWNRGRPYFSPYVKHVYTGL